MHFFRAHLFVRYLIIFHRPFSFGLFQTSRFLSDSITYPSVSLPVRLRPSLYCLAERFLPFTDQRDRFDFDRAVTRRCGNLARPVFLYFRPKRFIFGLVSRQRFVRLSRRYVIRLVVVLGEAIFWRDARVEIRVFIKSSPAPSFICSTNDPDA